MIESAFQAEKETSRVEAFSDGVFAFAITLLVLDLKVPQGSGSGRELLAALAREWPSYLGYLTSFFTIGVMWINHHRMFNLIHRSDDGLLLRNTLFLLGITSVPFSTSINSEYLNTPAGTVSAAIYSATYVVMALLFNLLWRYAARDRRLLGRHASQELADSVTRAYSYGPFMYLGSLLLAFVSPTASFALNMAYAVFWALPSQNPFLGG